MIYNKSARKRNSRAIIDKAEKLDQEVSNYKSRIDGLVDKITKDGEDDVANRENMLEYTHLYLDTFNEMRHLGHYKWNPLSRATHFLNGTTKISIAKYIPGWSEFYSNDVSFEDNAYLWNVFMPYSIFRPTDLINLNVLWPNILLRAENQQQARAITPTIAEFQQCIVPMAEKPYVVAIDVLDECQKCRDVILDGNTVKTRSYPNINLDDLKITPAGSKIAYSNFNGNLSYGYKTYAVETNDSGKSENYAKNLVNNDFRVGMVHFFCSDDKKTFGFGKVIRSHVRTERISLKSAYMQESSQSSSSGFNSKVYDSDDSYWDCNYYANITFEFTYINGSKTMKLFGDMTESYALDILKSYHSNLKSLLETAYKYQKSALESIKTEDNGKYDEYIKFLNEAQYPNLTKAVENNNTVVNSIRKWISDRVKELYNTVQDGLAAEAYRGILQERMNKNEGSLYSWYAHESIPLAEAYISYKYKIADGLYSFKMMLAAPVLDLDYSLPENGDTEYVNPNFVDVELERYPYYKMAGKNVNFKKGDEVYIMDNDNPEFTAKILKTEDWTGKYNDKETKIRRLFLDKTVSSVYDSSSLRVVLLFS